MIVVLVITGLVGLVLGMVGMAWWADLAKPHEHDKKESLGRVVKPPTRGFPAYVLREVYATYLCSCGVVWQVGENENVEEYKTRLAEEELKDV